ncbi:bifunctional GTP diphosphokinase/guanosine-3',5'-bis pyrophosphate 3'-pyrophosphohydrolase [Aliidiomarina sp. Khilg15.8]
MYLFEGLRNQVSAYLPAEQVDRVYEAFKVSFEAHGDQKRQSGEPYITHPVAVAAILAEMRLDHETLMAALLHDVIEDTPLSKEDLAETFGATVAELVEGVSKLDKLKFSSKEELQTENYRKMIMAMVQDIRVILIKLADRTHNMRTIGHLRPDKRRRIARETLDIYAPLAHRLGIHDLKNELESLGFKAMYPMRARFLESEVMKARGNRKELLQRVRKEIITRLEEIGIDARVYGREKHLFSIYRKMLNKELKFDEVMDIYAFRVVVESVDTCYRVIGAVHNLYKPIETRFKDYIAIPKSNGYQSLHTSLKGPHGVPVEIQVRTEEMDLMADRGVAAHWLYKDNDDNSSTTAQVRAQKWMQSLLELQQSAGSSFEFIENVKSELFPEEIYVFAPDGRIVELPQGATPVDFAYAVHTDVGNTCIGARVNLRAYSLSKPLETGQTIEIRTAPGSRPNIAWLNFVVTGKARAKIRQMLKTQESDEAQVLGERLLRAALGSVNYDEIAASEYERVAKEMKRTTKDELIRDIGLGNLMGVAVARRLLGDEQGLRDENDESSSRSLSIKGADGLLVSFAKCCRPIPGDDIIAHVSPGKGLVIHRRECKNVRGFEDEPGKYFPVQWDNKPDTQFVSELRVEMVNHQGALARLTSAIAGTGCNIHGLKTEEIDSSIYYIDVALTINDRKHLADVMRQIRKMSNVQRVSRLRK